MVGAELGLCKGQILFAELKSLGVPPQRSIAEGEVVHAVERVGVIRAERGFSSRERFFSQLQSF